MLKSIYYPEVQWVNPDIQNIYRTARSKQTKKVIVKGKSVEIKKPFSSPEDWRDQFIYEIMVDRFNNPDAPPNNNRFTEQFGGFQGGKFKGITAKLDYLKSLGVTAIWLTPVFKNVQNLNGNPNDGTYHGYGIQDFLSIEPRFGSDPEKPEVAEQELIELIDQAHARGIYIILDVVVNHSGDVFHYEHSDAKDNGSKAPYRGCPENNPNCPDRDFRYPILWRNGDGTKNPRWSEAPLADDPELTPDAAVFPDELRQNRFFRRQGNFFDEGTNQFRGDFESLKEFVTEFREFTPERGDHFPVRDIIIKAYQFAIAKYDVDGYRIDALKHVEPDFSRVFGNAIREFAFSIGKKNFFTFGEIIGGDEEIARFVGRFASEQGSLSGVDSALDFPLEGTLTSVVKGFTPPSELAELFESRKEIHRGQKEIEPGRREVLISSHGEASRFYVTFLDNHDSKDRFRFVDTGSANPNKFDAQVSMAIGCLFGLQGITVLYYGTEQGLDGIGERGKSDKAVREALWGKPDSPFDTSNIFYKATQDIAAIHKCQPALRYGRQFFRQLSGDGKDFGISPFPKGVIAFSRILNDMEVVVVANTNTEQSFSDLKVVVDFALNSQGLQLDLLYSNQGANATPPGKIETIQQSSGVTIRHLRGPDTNGPVRVLPVTLRPMELQIIGNKINDQSVH